MDWRSRNPDWRTRQVLGRASDWRARQAQSIVEQRPSPETSDVAVQRRGSGSPDPVGDPRTVAAQGVSKGGGTLPHAEAIQKSFGAHDVGSIRAHVGGDAAEAAAAIGAEAYATGNDVAFRRSPDLHTAAHEAAHVIQQRAGVSLLGGVGTEGDAYERHADAVADAVVRGESAEALLDQMSGNTGAASQPRIQRRALQLLGDRTIKQRPPEKPPSEARRAELGDLQRRELILRAAGNVARAALEHIRQLGKSKTHAAERSRILDPACTEAAAHLGEVFDGGEPLPATDLSRATLARACDFAWDWGQILVKERGDSAASAVLQRRLEHLAAKMRPHWSPKAADAKLRWANSALTTFTQNDLRQSAALTARRIRTQVAARIDATRNRIHEGPALPDMPKELGPLARWTHDRLRYLHGLVRQASDRAPSLRAEIEGMSAEIRRLQRWTLYSDSARVKSASALEAMLEEANALRAEVGLPAIGGYESPNSDAEKAFKARLEHVRDAHAEIYNNKRLAALAVKDASAAKDRPKPDIAESVLWYTVELALTMGIGGLGGAVGVAAKEAYEASGASTGSAKVMADALKAAAKAGVRDAVGLARKERKDDTVDDVREDFFEGVIKALNHLEYSQKGELEERFEDLKRAEDPAKEMDDLRKELEALAAEALEAQKLATLQQWMNLVARAESSAGRIFPPTTEEGIDFDPSARLARYPTGTVYMEVYVPRAGRPTIKRCSVGINRKLRRILARRRIGDLSVPLHIDFTTPNGGRGHVVRNDAGTIWTSRSANDGLSQLAERWLSLLAGEDGHPTDDAVLRGARILVETKLADARLPAKIEGNQ